MGKKVWCDWGLALGSFHENLLKIGAHLRKHSAIENAELYAAQVDEADRLFKEWRETDVSLPWGRTLEKLEEKKEEKRRKGETVTLFPVIVSIPSPIVGSSRRRKASRSMNDWPL